MIDEKESRKGELFPGATRQLDVFEIKELVNRRRKFRPKTQLPTPEPGGRSESSNELLPRDVSRTATLQES